MWEDTRAVDEASARVGGSARGECLACDCDHGAAVRRPARRHQTDEGPGGEDGGVLAPVHAAIVTQPNRDARSARDGASDRANHQTVGYASAREGARAGGAGAGRVRTTATAVDTALKHGAAAAIGDDEEEGGGRYVQRRHARALGTALVGSIEDSAEQFDCLDLPYVCCLPAVLLGGGPNLTAWRSAS